MTLSQHLLLFWHDSITVLMPMFYGLSFALPFWIYLFIYAPLSKKDKYGGIDAEVTKKFFKVTGIFMVLWIVTLPVHMYYASRFRTEVVKPYQQKLKTIIYKQQEA